jgi:hypothetical protein
LLVIAFINTQENLMTDRKQESSAGPRKPGGKPGGGNDPAPKPKDPHDPMRKPEQAGEKGKRSGKPSRKS